MKTNFDNAAFLQSINPDVNLITKLKSDRNWAFGISGFLVVAFGGYLFWMKHQEKLQTFQTPPKLLAPETAPLV